MAYRVSKAYYEGYFRGFLQQSGLAEPATLLQFKVTLPFALQLSELELTFPLGDGDACDLYFTHIPWQEPHHYGGGSDELYELPENRCQCDLCFLTQTQSIEAQAVADIFDRLLEPLNDFLAAYKIATNDAMVYPLDPRALESVYLYNVVTLPAWREEKGILLLHDKIPFVKEHSLPADAIGEVIRLTQTIRNGQNPFTASILIFSDAYRFLHYGELRQAVINAQTGIEGFASALYRLLCDQKKSPRGEKAKRPPFMRLIKRELPCLLGCSWEIADPGSVVGRWYQNSYQCRNRVVHEGYLPTPPEACEAVDSAYRFRLLLVELLKKTSPALARQFFAL